MKLAGSASIDHGEKRGQATPVSVFSVPGSWPSGTPTITTVAASVASATGTPAPTGDRRPLRTRSAMVRTTSDTASAASSIVVR